MKAISMTRKYYEGPETLAALVNAAGSKGQWSETNGCYLFKSQRGGVLSYWPKTSTVSVQGKDPGKGELEAVLDGGDAPQVAQHAAVAAAAPLPNKKVFVVYG